MSILQPVVDKLFEDRNRVMMDPERYREPMTVTALALLTVRDEPVQLVFCDKHEYPLVFRDEMVMDPDSRDNNLIRTVGYSDQIEHYVRRGDYSKCKNSEDVFATLIGSFYGPEVKLLEFTPVKTVYPTYYDYRKLRDAFDEVTNFLDDKGFIHHPRMLIGLNWVSPEQRHNREEPKPLAYGNALIWSGSTGDIHWVTRNKGLTVSLGIAGSAANYNELLRFLRQFQPQGWVANSILPMPYHLPKDEAPAEPKPKPDNSVFYLNVMEHLANAQPGKIEDAIKGMLEVAAHKHLSKPVPLHAHASDEIHAQVEALNSIFATKQGELDYEVLTTLAACERKHCPATNPGIRDQYVRALEEAINETFVVVDGVGVKKRDEIKRQLLAHFLKRFQDPSKLS